MNIADEVRRLEEENIELKVESEHRKNLLIDQHAKYKQVLGRRDQQLVDAAAAMDKAEEELAKKDAEIRLLSDELARFRLARDLLNDARFGESPFDRKSADEQRPLALPQINQRSYWSPGSRSVPIIDPKGVN